MLGKLARARHALAFVIERGGQRGIDRRAGRPAAHLEPGAECVERLFGGRAAPLFAHLVEAEALTSEDIAEIERLLAELKK